MAAGTIPLSGTQQFDVLGKPLNGGQLFVIVAGTVSTPQDAFVDVGLTIKMPYPITLDAAGRVPFHFLDNSVNATVKIRLQDKHGVVQLASDAVLIIGPAGGSGGGTTVDPTQLIQTGNMITRYGVGALAGYVRLNGLTIGSATSGATERANADCQSCFQYLWSADGALVVSGGRGASAVADWTANKQLALPDYRGMALAGLADMGNTPTSVLNATYFGADPTKLGNSGGGQSYTIAGANLPPYTPSGTIANGAITSTFTGTANLATLNLGASGSSQFFGGSQAIAGINGSVTSTQAASLFTGTAQGGGSVPFPTVGPTRLCTIYLKL